MIIRKYHPSDCLELTELFFNTVYTVNAKDYTGDQLFVWADGHIDLNAWNTSFLNHYSIIVAVKMVEALLKKCSSHMVLADQGYISKELKERLAKKNICFWTPLRKNMKGHEKENSS